MKTLIAVPCMDMIQTSFVKSLFGLISTGETKLSFRVSSLVYDSRNTLAGEAITQGYDRILFLDSDMAFQPDLFIKLSKDMDEGREYVTGLCFKRKPPFTPVIYKELAYKCEGLNPEMKLESYLDYPKDEIFEIAGSGCAAVMMTTDLINRVGAKFGYPFSPLMGFGEDVSFCWRVQQLGVPMFCDSRIKVGHVGLCTITEEIYQNTR